MTEKCWRALLDLLTLIEARISRHLPDYLQKRLVSENEMEIHFIAHEFTKINFTSSKNADYSSKHIISNAKMYIQNGSFIRYYSKTSSMAAQYVIFLNLIR